MIGLDTNVVVRLLVQDDAAQLRRARKAIAERCSEKQPGFVNRIVIVEVAWVLDSAYGYSRDQIATAIQALLQVRELEVEDPEQIWEALHVYREAKAGFSDVLLSLSNRERGCETTLTFDRKAAKLDTFSNI